MSFYQGILTFMTIYTGVIGFIVLIVIVGHRFAPPDDEATRDERGKWVQSPTSEEVERLHEARVGKAYIARGPHGARIRVDDH